ncbi:hypothetical protein BJ684DRAFT_14525 [Piptocephalis cylindrospora]|uniref:DASH complex subunit DAM1 n=1 Tax=Piptocephalis cylindrospora TaxID=1907219 RepID=A0A4P9Y9T2_9FUNG|nr:hypothetical protein BJ684DRAFT_14525 [Piptocephalis cylindrospora]|eukprot:RKP15201.1 hypothetical protein BJ684DRAFT_14525 [Piptocephalis cylindrospora]
MTVPPYSASASRSRRMTLATGMTPHHRRRTLGGRRMSMAAPGVLDRAGGSRRLSRDSFGPAIAQLDSAFTSLEKNLRNLQSLNDSLDSFNDAFSCLLGGLTLNATAGVTFPEAPTSLSFRRSQRSHYTLPSFTLPSSSKLAEANRPSVPRMGQSAGADTEISFMHDTVGLTLPATPSHAPSASTSTPIPSKMHMPVGTDASVSGVRRGSKLPVRKSQIPLPSTPMTKGTGKKSMGKADPASAPDRTLRRAKKKNELPVRKIIQTLPPKYRHPPHAEVLASILRIFGDIPQGLLLQEVVQRSGAPKHRCIEYLNTLVSTAHLLRSHRKGMHYRLNPARHPGRGL